MNFATNSNNPGFQLINQKQSVMKSHNDTYFQNSLELLDMASLNTYKENVLYYTGLLTK